MKKIHQDVWCGTIALIFLVFAYICTIDNAARDPESVFMPRIAIGIMTFLAILILLKGFQKTREAANNCEELEMLFTWDSVKAPLAAFGYIAGYIALYWCVGYMIATPIFMLCFMRHLKMKDWKMIITITAVFMLIVYVFFVLVLHVRVMNFGAISTYLLR